MIIVKLIGGLGNQLFQYSLGRHLAEIHRTILKLDLSYFKKKGSRKYSLEVFDIQENIASRKEIYQIIFKDQSFIEKWRRMRHRLERRCL